MAPEKSIYYEVYLIVLLLGTMQITASVTYSQSVKLSLNVENMTVQDVLSMIEQKSSFYFTYNLNQVNVNRKSIC